jgi:ubiquinone/menaquinone biosynthesis C-methylase UbiE
LKLVVADGERLPFADRSVAATVCNSVIEHVENAHALATEIRRVSAAYFVQTPNGRFPLELHAKVPIPLYRWVPSRRLRRGLCRLFGGDYEYIESVRYLSDRELARMFPEARIVRERWLGLTKSFYVIRPRD